LSVQLVDVKIRLINSLLSAARIYYGMEYEVIYLYVLNYSVSNTISFPFFNIVTEAMENGADNGVWGSNGMIVGNIDLNWFEIDKGVISNCFMSIS